MKLNNATEKEVYNSIKKHFSDYKCMNNEPHNSLFQIKKFRNNIVIYQPPYEFFDNLTRYGDFILLDKDRGVDMFIEVCSLEQKNSILPSKLNKLFGVMGNILAKEIVLILIGEGFNESTSDSMKDILRNRMKDVPKTKSVKIFRSVESFKDYVDAYFT